MKTTFLLLATSMLGLVTAQAQQPNPPVDPPGGGDRNPYLIQGFVDPAPMLPAEFNGTGQLIFDVGNTGSDPIVWVTNQEMLITISLSYGKPNVANPEDALDAINAIGGPGAAFFTWLYFPDSRTFRATQAADLPGNWRETITIDYKVVENSFSGASYQNGFNTNISPPGYTNPQPTDDDSVAAYTFVAASDFSDAPSSYGVASHEVNFRRNATSGIYTSYVYLGNAVDPESAMAHSAQANGDDNSQTAGLAVDDEDGVAFPEMVPGTTVQVPVSITLNDYDEFETSSIRLFGWVDWDKNGTFENATERFTTFSLSDYLAFDLAEPAFTGPKTFVINVPLTIPANATGTYISRFRIGPNIGATGNATYGEVEDHAFAIPESKSATFSAFLVDNAALFGLDDNTTSGASTPGVPAIDPLTGVANANVSDVTGNDFGGNAALTGNVDGDVYNNLLEFALCFDPGSGAKVFPDGTANKGLHLELNGSSLDAKFSGPTGVTDVTYQLQISTDGQTWSDMTTPATATTDGPVNGTTTYCYEDLDTSTPGLLRLKVSAGTGAAATTAVTGPVGWQMANVKDFCQTYSDPLLEPCLVTGTITGVTGQVLDLTQAAGTQGLTARLEVGKSYYLEVIAGENLGHIFDIASFEATSLTLATDTDLCALSAPYSTKLTVPSDLAADMFIIREHKTLENLFPIDDLATGGVPEGFAAGVNASNSGKLIRYNRDGGLESYIANSGPGGANTWVASTTGLGAPDNILPPGEGIFTHNLLGEPDLPILQFGEVRATQLAVPLKEGYNFVAAAHPIVSQSIDGEDSTSRLLNASGSPFTFEGNGARSLADQVQFWQDDTAADAASTHICYDMIFYLRNASGTVDIWSKGGISTPTMEEAKGLFDPTRSAMYCIQKDDMLDYYLPSPISNAVN
ncbi:GEVED domain-containing protein [Verrucomicrobiaceae bacterium 227]